MTTDDKTLLKLAAKAAGLNLDWNSYTAMNIHRPMASKGETNWFAWNPLTDDGDALRLAVKLDLAVMPYPVFANPKHSVVASQKNLEHSRFEVVELHNSDPYAATRLAIVRAAAEIGESM